MPQVLPLVCGGQFAGSAVVVLQAKDHAYLATALHLLGSSDDIQVALRHGGVTPPQVALQTEARITPAEVVATDPFCDLAILRLDDRTGRNPPRICVDKNLPAVGTEVVVSGYPSAPIGPMLETRATGHVTARARHQIAPGVLVDEVVLSVTARPGSSGSAVIGRRDGVLYGILRGALAPLESTRIGNLPVAEETTVRSAISAAHLLPLIKFSNRNVDLG